MAKVTKKASKTVVKGAKAPAKSKKPATVATKAKVATKSAHKAVAMKAVPAKSAKKSAPVVAKKNGAAGKTIPTKKVTKAIAAKPVSKNGASKTAVGKTATKAKATAPIEKAVVAKAPIAKSAPRIVAKDLRPAGASVRITPQSASPQRTDVKAGMTKKDQQTNSNKNKVTSKVDTQNAPAMRLTVNDAEILMTATEHYGAKDLEYFTKIIAEQRAEASEEFDILSEQMLDTSGEFDSDNQSYSTHTAEQGTDAMEREKTFLHAQRTSDYIKKLDEALARTARGTYGICVICGKLIEKQRLAAVPITQKHVDCKNKTQAKKLSVDQTFRDDEPASE